MAGARASTVGRLDGGRRALTTLKAKLTRFLVERTEDLIKRDELDEQRARPPNYPLKFPLGKLCWRHKDQMLAAPVQRLTHAAKRREEKSYPHGG
jgi:hypothetical protein